MTTPQTTDWRPWVGIAITILGLIFTAGAGWHRLGVAEAEIEKTSDEVHAHAATPGHQVLSAEVQQLHQRLQSIEAKVDVYGRNQAAICQALGAQCR